MRYITDICWKGNQLLQELNILLTVHVNDIHITCLCTKISAMWYKKKKLSIYKQHLMDFKSSDSYHSQNAIHITQYRVSRPNSFGPWKKLHCIMMYKYTHYVYFVQFQHWVCVIFTYKKSWKTWNVIIECVTHCTCTQKTLNNIQSRFTE